MKFEIQNCFITDGGKNIPILDKSEQEIVEVFELGSKHLKQIRQNLVQESLKYAGAKRQGYCGAEKGQSVETGFDCSGFVTFLLQKFGLSIEGIRHSNEYFDRYGIFLHQDKVQAGDLIFFSWNGLRPQHMGLIISDKQYIHCSQKNKGVAISEINIKPIEPGENQIYTTNPIGFKRISLNTGNRYLII